MKAFLMYEDHDFDPQKGLPANDRELMQDLELDTLLRAMALDDDFLYDMTRTALLSSLTEPGEIEYRQRVLADCMANPSTVREIYDIVVAAVEGERRNFWGLFSASPELVLSRSVQVLEFFVTVLQRLRQVADDRVGRFRSDGFTRFFGMLSEELGDDYFEEIRHHLKELRFRRGVLVSAELGKGNKGVNYVLRTAPEQTWLQRITEGGNETYSFQIADRDERGAAALAELKGRGVNLVANALGQSVDHILSFFKMVRAELAFYLGCLNLSDRLTEKGEPMTFPTALRSSASVLSAQGLYDICLSLNIKPRVVGNELKADGKSLIVITGANRGGKSTFLRCIGVAHLMMQSGMFVPAELFRASVCAGIFTHYKREEDIAMESGKLDEELSRMSGIVDSLTPHCLVLCNESFAATNEREGSEIGRQVVRALVQSSTKVVFVTHMYDLAHGWYSENLPTALFLRAERKVTGHRTFKLFEGEPEPTSYGEDLYRRIFAIEGARASVG